MANRCLLHKNKLEEFKSWLISDGWEIEPIKGNFEVLRARHPQRANPLIVYTKLQAKEHYSVMDRDTDVINYFLADQKKDQPVTEQDIVKTYLEQLMIDVGNIEVNTFLSSGGDVYGRRAKTPQEIKDEVMELIDRRIRHGLSE